MVYLVCYDISSDATRTRMSNTLLDFGTRIQESVFECLLNEGMYTKMMARLERLPLGDADRVRVYRICGSCVGQVHIYGAGDPAGEPDYYLV